MSIWQADGYWVRDTYHYPRPVLPLFVSYGLEPVEVGSARAYEECSFPIERYRYLVLHGYVFQRSEPYGGDAPPINHGTVSVPFSPVAREPKITPANFNFRSVCAGRRVRAQCDSVDGSVVTRSQKTS